MTIREYGYKIGEGKPGPNNDITDIPGVMVGQVTVKDENHNTGVTVIIPCEGNVFTRKPVAAAFVANGFGKTMGTIQVEELGTIETPIALTNTLNVGKVADALVEYTVKECDKDGVSVRSVNPLVGETNDSKNNRIVDRVVEKKHVFKALETADKKVQQGDVGAGAGTICFGLKGGIGSSSRTFNFEGKKYTIGVLVQSNYGSTRDLMLDGNNIGKDILKEIKKGAEEDKGSIMIVVGTDLPLSARQLKRVIKRATVGMVRCGSYMGHGSGDVFLGFTNGNFMGQNENKDGGFISVKAFPEDRLDTVFRLVAEATEESILNSMAEAKALTGLEGETYHSLSEFLT